MDFRLPPMLSTIGEVSVTWGRLGQVETKALGEAELSGKAVTLSQPDVALFRKPAFDHGRLVGTLAEAKAAYDRMDGYYDIDAFRDMAMRNGGAIKDALAIFKESPELSGRFQKALGILENAQTIIERQQSDYFTLDGFKGLAQERAISIKSALDALRE